MLQHAELTAIVGKKQRSWNAGDILQCPRACSNTLSGSPL